MTMTMILRAGQAAGLIGLVLMAIAVAARLAGSYLIAGFESGSLLQAGIGATAAGCFLLLWVMATPGRS